jgi:hypothetical protein
MGRSAPDVAAAVGAVFTTVFDLLAEWREPVEALIAASARNGAAEPGPAEPPTEPAVTELCNAAELDDVVAGLVVPAFGGSEPLLVGAGFIADASIVRGRDVHFAWWLAPLTANPVHGRTTAPTRLDLSSRGYTEYLRDFRSLEWYRVPAVTDRRHVTGPYVDHLCTCDYTLTLTLPVHAPNGNIVGVLGADLTVRRLERELLAAFLDVPVSLALVNAAGRVVLSTAPAVQVGQLADMSGPAASCPGTPFTVLSEPIAAGVGRIIR